MSWQENLSNLLLKNLPFSLEFLPPQACLVGGAVRDAWLNRQGEYLDLDFVLPKLAVETAQKIANYYHAGFVVLDCERQIARVVFPQGTVDFAQQEGDSLEADLRRRDFTVNAIAYNPHHSQLIDPLQGVADLQQGVLRMICTANLEDDPLRLLRAYRQAAQLNFTIEAVTRSTIRTLAPLLAKVAAERVQTELGYLLGSLQGNAWLKAAWEDGLLQFWFQNAQAENLNQLARVDDAAKSIAEIVGRDAISQLFPSSKDRIYPQPLQLAKLASLLSRDATAAESELVRLKYSRAEIRTVTSALKHLPRLLQAQTQPMSLREQYFFFLDVGDVFPVLVVLGMAVGLNPETITPLLQRYLNPQDQVAHPTPLVTGHDLIQKLKLRPSPQIGQLLTQIQLARIEGKITTGEEALELAACWLKSAHQ